MQNLKNEILNTFRAHGAAGEERNKKDIEYYFERGTITNYQKEELLKYNKLLAKKLS